MPASGRIGSYCFQNAVRRPGKAVQLENRTIGCAINRPNCWMALRSTWFKQSMRLDESGRQDRADFIRFRRSERAATSGSERSFAYRMIPCRNSDSKTEHTQKAHRTQLVAFGWSNSLNSVVMAARKSRGYTSAQLSDSDWEADVLPLNYTRFFGS